MDTEGLDEIRGRIERRAELGRARAEADGWRKVAERRLKHIAECEAALRTRNERISKLEKQVAVLRAELANAEVPSERERQIIGMWPRFEDGEPVWFGDAVEAHNGGAITVEAIEFSHGDVCVKDAEDGDWDTSMYAMQPLKRPAPADSWERLEEDARKGACEYAGAYLKRDAIDSHECDGCRFDSDGNGPTCEQQMALDIIRRAKALAGAEVD